MMRLRFASWLCAFACSFSAGSLLAQDAKPKPALSPSEADSDAAFQGEYSGDITIEGQSVRYGAQIIALGKGHFHGVGYPGGLPGDGFLGGEKLEGDGILMNDQIEFPEVEAMAVVRDGAIIISTTNGEKLGELRHVKRESPTLGAKPPTGAVVLFDGKSADTFENGKLSEDGLLMQGVTSREKFQNATVHLEFLLSYMPEARGQARANSGCYLQGRYEVQILDSFGLSGENNECGGIYGIRAPSVNMCYPPMTWQTYDIDFTAAKFDSSGNKTADARMTVKHNGEVIHKDVAVPKTTTAAPVKEGPEPGPLYLQDHGNPIRFRNIWIVERP
ncbi:DUF1080 domain-containing protein [bacterium]|nr:DUF1080 domain-containing protein [bacterium]